jgi:hypothetical protein
MSYSKTRTTYRPSTHPTKRNNEPIKDLVISIVVTPAPTYAELSIMRNQTNAAAMSSKYEDACDKLVWIRALDAEISRCKPLTDWMKMQRKEQAHPTQHARIDPAQAEQLRDLLTPETLRRTFISIPMLMNRIQSDLHGLK